MKRIVLIALCGLLSSMLVACYDLTADGKVITGATVSLYTLDEQQIPIKTLTSESDENPTLNGVLNFFTMPEGYSPDDLFYLVQACGGAANGVAQEGCRYAIIAARFFFVEEASNSWEGFRNFWNMTLTTDAMARVVKDTYSHNELSEIEAVLDEVTATYFPNLDTNDNGVTSYSDLTHAAEGNYGTEVDDTLLSQITEALTAALAQEEPEPDPDTEPEPDPDTEPEPDPDPEVDYPELTFAIDGIEAGRGYQFRSDAEVCLVREGGNLEDLDIDYTLYLKITQPDTTPLEEAGSNLLPLDENDCYTFRLGDVGVYGLIGFLITDEATPERVRAGTDFRSEDEPATPDPTPAFDVEAACLARARDLGFINLSNAIVVYECTEDFATGGMCGPDDLGRTVSLGEDLCSIAYQ